jgi:hypothetical protein
MNWSEGIPTCLPYFPLCHGAVDQSLYSALTALTRTNGQVNGNIPGMLDVLSVWWPISLLSLAPGVVFGSRCVEAYHVSHPDTESLDRSKNNTTPITTILILSFSVDFKTFLTLLTKLELVSEDTTCSQVIKFRILIWECNKCVKGLRYYGIWPSGNTVPRSRTPHAIY